ncbi:30S ribosomal protein S6 [Planctomycetes bacterium Poly30]|uniref:Small ribosomal subunit protein bS6 n=1 Tax=Saltatorellus ferox TaxID=2528018 RepID=A0A518ER98_9BACT|nr:30S ribosomal protein S6 [Planctomycetes bacterium Poly30]
MVLLDNDVVRADWKKAKSIVTDTITKYDGTIHSCRRWDEKRLAYPINRKNRATYYLAYFEMAGDKIPGFRRDFELNERVLRSLIVCVDEVSEDEKKLAAEEDGTEYTVPEPPEDDALEAPDEVEEDDDDDLDMDVPAEAGAMDNGR